MSKPDDLSSAECNTYAVLGGATIAAAASRVSRRLAIFGISVGSTLLGLAGCSESS